MTKIVYVAREKSGVSYITLAPATQPLTPRINLLDSLLVATFLTGTLGLIIFLVK
jgi:hypothetical protein